MKIRNLILPVVILIGIISCAKKNYIYCGLSDLNSIKKEKGVFILKSENFQPININSELLEFERIGISDTTTVKIYGEILENSTHENDTLVLPFANIFVRDIKTDSIFGTTSNIKGEYELIVPKSEYHLEIQFIGFNKLRIKNLKTASGEIIKLSGILGEGNSVREYKLKSNETID